MVEKLLIEKLAEREGRGHAELRRMAKAGVLKDDQGNLVHFEDLSYDPPAPNGDEMAKPLEESWDEYVKGVTKLRDLQGLTEDQQAEWDKVGACSERLTDMLSSLRNFSVHNDNSWKHAVADKAVELHIEIKEWHRDVKYLITRAEDEDRQVDSEA